MAGPWEKYQQSTGGRPVYRELPPQPAPRHPEQAQSDALTVEEKRARLESIPLDREAKRLDIAAKQADLRERQAKAAEAEQKRAAQDQGMSDTLANIAAVIRDARTAQKMSNEWFATGFGSGAAKNIEGTAARDLATILNRIGANTAFDRLQKMRNESPTGGALGQVSNIELELLKSSVGSLDQGASDPRFRENIQNVIDHYTRVYNALGGDPETLEGPEPVIQGSNRETVEVARGGTRIENNPALAGVNRRIGEMLQSGASNREIIQFLDSVGASRGAQMDVLRQLQEYKKFKREAESKGKKVGLPTIDLERWEVENSALNRISSSPFGAAAIEAANVVTGNHLDNIVELTGGNGELANIGMEQMRRDHPIASLVGGVAGGAGLYGAGRGALAMAGRGGAPTGTFAPSAVGGDAAMGAYIGSGANGTQGFDPMSAGMGAVAGMGGGIAGRGAINTAGRALSPSGGALAPAYAEGVKPTMGQRMGGIVNRAEQAFASIPAVGGIQRAARNRAVEDWQAGAFNQALREIGTELPKGIKTGTAAHAYMQNQFNAAYNKARSGLTFRIDPEFTDDFRAIAQEVAALSPTAQKRFTSIVQMGENKIKARGGVLSGDDYKTLVSTIDKRVRALRKSPQGDYELADVLEDLTLALDKGARRHSPPEAVAALAAADRGYVKAVLIEEAGRKAGGGEFGEFTGKQLESAIRGNSGLRSRRALRGEAALQDYAAAGTRLGQTMPDSGTPERLMYGAGTAGAVGGAAHLIDPIAASPWIVNTLANLPGGRQAFNLLVSPNRKGLDPARQKLLERAYLGGLLAAPAAEGATQ